MPNCLTGLTTDCNRLQSSFTITPHLILLSRSGNFSNIYVFPQLQSIAVHSSVLVVCVNLMNTAVLYISQTPLLVLRSKVNMETGSRKQKFGGNRIRSN